MPYTLRHNKSTECIVQKYTITIAVMTYNISKLADFNPALATEIKNRCYTIVGLCQQVHREMGPFLNEYMYQEALDISLEENGIEKVKEYYFWLTSKILSRGSQPNPYGQASVKKQGLKGVNHIQEKTYHHDSAIQKLTALTAPLF